MVTFCHFNSLNNSEWNFLPVSEEEKFIVMLRHRGRAIQILLCGSLIPILLSFLMTINEDIYSAQFGCRPQNVEVCPSATFIGVDISRLHRPAFPCHNIFQHTNSSKAKRGQIPKYQKSECDILSRSPMAAWINIVDDDDEHFCLPTRVNWMWWRRTGEAL